jgi:hypothetical protein
MEEETCWAFNVMRKLTLSSRAISSPQDLYGAEVVLDPDLHEAYQVSVCRPFSLYPLASYRTNMYGGATRIVLL